MTTLSNGVPDPSLDEQVAAPATLSPTRPLYWSIRREIWENRAVYRAPLAVAAIVLFASLIGMHHLKLVSAVDPAQQHLAAIRPLRFAPAPIMFVTFLVGMFYALDALYGERRDRSILFWKSLPVSDVTTVAAKASILLVVLPLIAFLISLATVLILLLVSTVVLVAKGVSPARLWAEAFLQQPVIMLYGLAAHALWFAPIYGWLLLVSAWARRAPFLWAVVPPLALAFVERIAFQTSYVRALMRYRVSGAMAEAFTFGAGAEGDVNRLAQLTPLRFLTAPGLWLGLAAAAFFLAMAVRLRRRGEPI